METVGILVLGLAVLTFACASTEKDSLDDELAAALETFIYSRGVDAGYYKRGDDDLGVGDLSDAVDALGGDGDGEDDDDDDRRALLSTFEELALDAREASNTLTEEEESLVNDLANLDDDTLQDLMENRELLADDNGMSARSAKVKVAGDLLISRLMSDHPDLRALSYGEDGSDPEDGDVLDRRGWGWAKSAWKKTKNFFKKVGDALTKVWNKWKKKVSDWLAKGGKALACRVCVNPTRTPGMSWSDFKTAKSKIQSLACAKCRTG